MWTSTYFGLNKPQKRNFCVIEEFKKDVRSDDNDISNQNYKVSKKTLKLFNIAKNLTISHKTEKLMACTN